MRKKQRIGGDDSIPRFADVISKNPVPAAAQPQSRSLPSLRNFYFKRFKRPHANASSSGETVVSASCRSGSGQPACINQNQEMPERIDALSDAVASGAQMHGTHTMTTFRPE
jgi:hypothetical protein